MIPTLQAGQDWHVVGLQLVKSRAEHIGQLAFVDKHRHLALAHRQFGAVFDLMALALEPPNHGVTAVIGPSDHINELAGKKIEKSHVLCPFSHQSRRLS